jgi:hypothetical protein
MEQKMWEVGGGAGKMMGVAEPKKSKIRVISHALILRAGIRNFRSRAHISRAHQNFANDVLT